MKLQRVYRIPKNLIPVQYPMEVVNGNIVTAYRDPDTGDLYERVAKGRSYKWFRLVEE